jgi:hypothetical protein
MDKIYKKSDINNYIGKLKEEHVMEEEEVNELIDTAGTLIDKNDNYKMGKSYIKSKKTTDDFIRSATQGPEAYFIYGGPYYGINYSYVVNEEENTDISENQVDEMKNLVDEIFLKKKDDRGIVKRSNEQGVLGDQINIPDISELKKTFEKPMVVRKLNHLVDLIDKEELNGEELAIILNHLLKNIKIFKLSDKHKEILGDKIKYGEEEENRG